MQRLNRVFIIKVHIRIFRFTSINLTESKNMFYRNRNIPLRQVLFKVHDKYRLISF